MVADGNMSPVPEKVQKILKLAVPTTKKQVRAILDLVGYYRRYVPNFSSIVKPLTDLTRKDKLL